MLKVEAPDRPTTTTRELILISEKHTHIVNDQAPLCGSFGFQGSVSHCDLGSISIEIVS